MIHRLVTMRSRTTTKTLSHKSKTPAFTGVFFMVERVENYIFSASSFSNAFWSRTNTSSFPRIYAHSNAPGENSIPERATRRGQRMNPFLYHFSEICPRSGFLISSRVEKSVFSRVRDASSRAVRTSCSVSTFIFGFRKRLTLYSCRV